MPDQNYYSLIRNWHIKAEEDYFSRFSFEYLAFIAFLKTQMLTEDAVAARTGRGRVTDRDYIQTLKQNEAFKSAWLNLVNRPGNHRLREDIQSLIDELNRARLLSDGDWWNCDAYDNRTKNCQNPIEGILVNQNDYVNLVEVWYVVRNNLFHGGKNPSVERDKLLVEFCYKTLAKFVEEILLRSLDRRLFHPASWEHFFERFFRGEAEVVARTGGAATVYELILLDDTRFPVIIGEQPFSREDLIERAGFHIANSDGQDHIEKIQRLRRFGRDEDSRRKIEEYFGGLIQQLEAVWGPIPSD